MLQVFRLLLLATAGIAVLALAQDEPAQNDAAEAEDTGQPGFNRETDEEDVFIPTEEIPADEEVTFPVNI